MFLCDPLLSLWAHLVHDFSPAIHLKLFLVHSHREAAGDQRPEPWKLELCEVLHFELEIVQTEFKHWAVWAFRPERPRCLILLSTGWIFCSSTCPGLQSGVPGHAGQAAGIHQIHPHSHLALVRPFHSESSDFWLADWGNTVRNIHAVADFDFCKETDWNFTTLSRVWDTEGPDVWSGSLIHAFLVAWVFWSVGRCSFQSHIKHTVSGSSHVSVWPQKYKSVRASELTLTLFPTLKYYKFLDFNLATQHDINIPGGDIKYTRRDGRRMNVTTLHHICHQLTDVVCCLQGLKSAPAKFGVNRLQRQVKSSGPSAILPGRENVQQ